MAASDLGDDLYAAFAPAERFVLVIEAAARDDRAEVGRLGRSCPRRTYTMSDAGYSDRMEVSLDVAFLAAADLHRLAARVGAVRWAREMLGLSNELLAVVAAMAFEDGRALGRGKPQLPYFMTRAERRAIDATPPTARAAEDGDAEAEADADPETAEWARRAQAVEDRVERAGAKVAAILLRRERASAGELAVAWAGFGRFCRERAGVEPGTLISAWGLAPAGLFPEVTAAYPELSAPDPARVARYFGRMCVLWDQRFGQDKGTTNDGGTHHGQR